MEERTWTEEEIERQRLHHFEQGVRLTSEIDRLTAELTVERNVRYDVEQCHANDHARNGDLIAEVDRLTAELAACRARLGEMTVLALQTSRDTELFDLARRPPIEFDDGAPVAVFSRAKEDSNG